MSAGEKIEKEISDTSLIEAAREGRNEILREGLLVKKVIHLAEEASQAVFDILIKMRELASEKLQLQIEMESNLDLKAHEELQAISDEEYLTVLERHHLDESIHELKVKISSARAKLAKLKVDNSDLSLKQQQAKVEKISEVIRLKEIDALCQEYMISIILLVTYCPEIDLNFGVSGDMSSLGIAVALRSFPQLVKLFLSAGADIRMLDGQGNNALFAAAFSGNKEALELMSPQIKLEDFQTKIEEKTILTCSAHYAMQANDFAPLEFLLATLKNFEEDAIFKKLVGYTIFRSMAMAVDWIERNEANVLGGSLIKMVRLLIESGTFLEDKYKYDEIVLVTSLEYAKLKGLQGCAQLLLNAGANASRVQALLQYQAERLRRQAWVNKKPYVSDADAVINKMKEQLVDALKNDKNYQDELRDIRKSHADQQEMLLKSNLWEKLQVRLRPRLLKAICSGNMKVVISMVKIGVCLNFSGLNHGGFEHLFLGSFSANVAGLTPLQVACFFSQEKVNMFIRLWHLGASIHGSNEHCRQRFGVPLQDMFFVHEPENESLRALFKLLNLAQLEAEELEEQNRLVKAHTENLKAQYGQAIILQYEMSSKDGKAPEVQVEDQTASASVSAAALSKADDKPKLKPTL